ncbi:MAG: PIN domain-containing protein [Terriglobales bacterium]|jgi:predicted nucleic acid-binding protein
MSDRSFVDTNILVYAHDRTTGEKHKRARRLVEQLWESGQGALSTQVLQELCVTLRRRAGQPRSVDDMRRLLHDYLSWIIVVNTADSVLQALDLEARYKISFWDALILQAAESAGAETLYSEDLSPGQKYGPVRVVNPLQD